MAGFMYPGLLSDWTDGMDPNDPRTMPQGLLAALSQGQGAQPMSNVPTMDGAQSPMGSGFQASPQPAPQMGGVPMPPQRPSRYDLPTNVTPAFTNTTQLEGDPSPDMPSQKAVPAGGAPFTPTQPGNQEPGGLEKLSTVLGGIYGQGGPGDGLINLGLALMSPGNKAENLMRAGQMAQMNDYKKSQLQAAQQKQMREMLALQGNMQTLKKAYPDWSQEQLAAAAQNPALVQEAVKTLNPSEVYRDLITPEDRAAHGLQTADVAPAQIDRTGKLFRPGTPVTNINTTPGTPAQVFTTVEKRADEARSAAQALPSFAEARRLVNSGNVILGQGADMGVAMQKIGGIFGLDTTAASNSETFRSAIAPTVLSLVKGLGAGSGISNADREFAEKAAGGNINLEPATIRRLLDLGERAARSKVDSHNSMVDSVYPEGDTQNGQVRSLFRVDVPQYQAPAAATPQAPAQATTGAPATATPVRVASPEQARQLPRGTPIILPDGRQGVVP